MIKLIASDMDGTLLSSDKKILESSVEAIKWARDRGIYFILSTGRPVIGIRRYISELGLEGPMITYNGGVIVDAPSEKIIYEETLAPDDARSIIEYGISIDTTLCIWVGNQLYSNKINERTDHYQTLSGVPPIETKDYDSLINSGINKILIYDIAENIPRLKKQIASLDLRQVLTIGSQPMFLENIHSATSKAIALKKIGEHLEIKPEEMMVFGDGENDIDMIKYAGTGIAMKNGASAVKEAADYITGSNDDGGIAAAIYKFCGK